MSRCNCQRQAEKDLDAVIQGELAIHQCSALVQTIYFVAEAATMARIRDKARHLWEVLDFLEGTVLRTLDTQVADYRFADFKAFIALLREGWRP